MQDTFGTLTDESTGDPFDALRVLEGGLAPGEVVGRYLVEERLGEGAMARVYRVEHRILGTTHALKVLKAQGQEVRERAFREARIQASLRHPNVVAVRDVLEVRGHAGLLLDFAPGATLRETLRERKPSLDEALCWFRDIAQGVEAAHQQGIVHRDLKPSNVLMVPVEGALRALVTDFGLARIEGGEDVVREGRAAGSPGYMAPEQIRDASSAGPAADQFALGCILYELTTGSRAFVGSDAASLMRRILAGERVPSAERMPTLPVHIVAVIERCLSPEPAGRYPDVNALLDALETSPQPQAQAPRGRVAFVFTDIEGSTPLWERSPGPMREALRVHDRVLRALARERGGYEVKHEGDAIMLAFAEPGAALAWCVEAQRQLAEASWPEGLPMRSDLPGLRVRMGVHADEVEAHVDPVSGRVDYLGAAVNRAARVSSAGHGGQVLCSEETWAAAAPLDLPLRVLDLGEHQLLGLDGLVRLLDIQHPELPERSFAPLRSVGGEQARPFRGLMRYSTEHAALFFGRDTELRRFAERVRAEPFVTLTGPSGTGKSSLIGAGLPRALPGVQVVTVRPGPRPMMALSAALEELLPEHEDLAGFQARLSEAPSTLGAHLARVAIREARTFVIVVDQAEELLTLCEDAAEREAFGEAIASLGLDAALPLRCVLVIREDLFGRLGQLRSLRGHYSRAVEVLHPPETDQLVRILTEPVALFGYRFEDAALPREMAEQVNGEPAALPLLQACAEQLWEARDRSARVLTWSAYRSLGGVRGALVSHAEGALRRLNHVQVAVARRVLLRLVNAEGTRTPATRAALIEASGSPRDAEIVLDTLVRERLLTASSGGGDGRLELAHESLVTQWQRLAGWLAEDIEGARLREALARAAAEWDAADRPLSFLWQEDRLAALESRQEQNLTTLESAFVQACQAENRRKRWRARGVGLTIVVVMSVLTLLMSINLRVANEARSVAEAALRQSEARGLMAQAVSAEQAGHPERAVALLRAAQSVAKGEDLYVIRSRLLRLLWAGSALIELPGTMALRGMALSEDGERVAMIGLQASLRVLELGEARGDVHKVPLVDRRPYFVADLHWLPGDQALLAHLHAQHPEETGGEAMRLQGLRAVLRVMDPIAQLKRWTMGDKRVEALSIQTTLPLGGALSPSGLWLASPGASDHALGLTAVEDSLSPPALRRPPKLPSGLGGRAHLRTLKGARWAPDGQLLAGVGEVTRLGEAARGAAWSTPGALAWDVESGEVFADAWGSFDLIPLSGRELLRLAEGPEGVTLSRVSVDGATRWSTAGVAACRWSSEAGRIVVTPDEQVAVLLGQGRALCAVQLRDGATRFLRDLPVEGRALFAMQDAVAVQAEDGNLYVFNPWDGRALREPWRASGESTWRWQTGSVLSSAGGLLRVGGAGVQLMRRASLERGVRSIELPCSGEWQHGGLDVFPQRSLLWGRCDGETSQVIDERGELLFEEEDEITSLASHDGRVAYTLAQKKQHLLVLRGASGEELGRWTVARGARVVALSQRGGRVAWTEPGAGKQRALRVLRLNTPEAQPLRAVTPGELLCAFDQEGGELACINKSGFFTHFDVSREDYIGVLDEHQISGGIPAMLHHEPGGAGFILSVADWGRDIGDDILHSYTTLWPQEASPGVSWVAPRGLVDPLRSSTFPPWGVAYVSAFGSGPSVVYTPDGRLAFRVNGDKLTVWDGRSGELLRQLEVPGMKREWVGLSSDGRRLIVFGDRTRLVLDMQLPTREQVNLALGTDTNLRVCRESLEVVAVFPLPDPETVWAPEALCEDG